MVNDPVADFVVQIKNAGAVGKSFVEVPYSKMKEAIAQVLVNTGYLKSFEVKGEGITRVVHAELSLKGGKSAIRGFRRISKPSRRLYTRVNELGAVKGGLGIAVLTTPKGVMDAKAAKEAHVGGEILFEIW